MLAIRAWEREKGKVHDWDRYESEVGPLIAVMTVPELVHLTGLAALLLAGAGRQEAAAPDALDPGDRIQPEENENDKSRTSDRMSASATT
jgi:hypothetical protein